jgi:hypothetical protein
VAGVPDSPPAQAIPGLRRNTFALPTQALAIEHLVLQWMLDGEVLSRATPIGLDALLSSSLVALLLGRIPRPVHSARGTQCPS